MAPSVCCGTIQLALLSCISWQLGDFHEQTSDIYLTALQAARACLSLSSYRGAVRF